MRLALGTAQFGLDYGIANQQGQITRNEARAIIDCAKVCGIGMLDTAIAYGDSERRLGEIGLVGWQVVSKLPPIPADCHAVPDWVTDAVKGSLSLLNIRSLYGLLLHRPQQLLESSGDELYGALLQLKKQGLVQKIGISIYDPVELDVLCDRFQFDLVQAPFNLLDRRLASSGWISRLKNKNIELHVRSVFLQGLILMCSSKRPKKFDRWEPLWARYDEWLTQTGLTPLEACLRYVLSFPEIGKLVIGVDSERQLKEIIQAVEGPVPTVPDTFATDDPDLINPRRWTSLS